MLGRNVSNQFGVDDGLADAAPPNRPTFPPRARGAIRVDDLMPVSSIWACVSCSHRRGRHGESAIWSAAFTAPSLSIVWPNHVEEAAQRSRTDRHRDRVAGIHGPRAAPHSVGGVHRQAADSVVAEVLLTPQP